MKIETSLEDKSMYQNFIQSNIENIHILYEKFDKKAFLKANSDIKDIKIDKFIDIAYDIFLGKRKFHIDFEPYDENIYLDIHKDVSKAIEDGAFKSGFSHFCLYGYKEIISNKFSWNTPYKLAKVKNSSGLKSVTSVIGIPRSGITLTTALIGDLSKSSVWFLPFTTRTQLGLESFEDFFDLQRKYIEVFPDEELSDSFVISESTAEPININKLFKSLVNLKKSGTDVKIVWVLRDLNYNYISQMESAYRFWEAKDIDISLSSYKSYIDFAFEGYKNIIEHCVSFDTMLISYASLVNDTKNIVKKVSDFIGKPLSFNNFDYDSLKAYNIAGDPSFLEYSSIVTDRDKVRSAKWSSVYDMKNRLSSKKRDFLDSFSKLLKLVEDNKIDRFANYQQLRLKEDFDQDYYLKRYIDIKESGFDPIKHYKKYGWKEDRDPTSNFNNRWYRTEVYSGNYLLTPFEHYILIGKFYLNYIVSISYQYDGIIPKISIVNSNDIVIDESFYIEAPVFKSPKVSIIIPAYNNERYTLATLKSIVNYTDDISYEIIVMDDNSSDNSAREIEKYLRNIKFISNGINYGFLGNCNKGTKFAIGKYLLFLNNDVSVQPEWLSSLVDLIESKDDIGMVGSRFIYPDGRQQEAGGIIWKDASGWNFGRLDDPSKPEYNYVREVDYISGASIMIKKELWDKIGGFDTRYTPAYYEDTDLAFEVRANGQRVMYQPKSIVVHFEGISHGVDTESGIKGYQKINKEKFFDKWRDVLEKEHFENGKELFFARDRSKNKKHLLYIDHYIPQYDQDAGSKATLQYLQILVNSGIKVHFLGDNFYHYPNTKYLEVLHQMGIEVLYGNWYAQHHIKWLKENSKNFDYVVLSRPHISIKYIDILKEYSEAKLLYMAHDLHFLRQKREYEIKKDKKYLQSSQEWLEKEIYLAKNCDKTLLFSSVEKDELKKIDKSLNIEVVPLYIYEHFLNNIPTFENRKDLMFVGGFGHTPNTDAVLWFVNEIFPTVKESIGNIKFYIIGSKPTKEILALSSDDIVVTGFISDEELEKYYQRCKIVVAPIRYGAGVKGKIVDALYNGMPIVTTSVGAEGLPNIEDTLCIANSVDDFAKSVIDLYSDNNKLNSYSKASLEYCKKYFSTTYAKEKLSNIFDFKEV